MLKKTFFALSSFLVAGIAFAEPQFIIEDGDNDAPENVMEFEEPRVFNLDFSNARVPVEQILHSGIVVDEIPTIGTPRFVSITEAEEIDGLNDEDYVVGVDVNGEIRLYPLEILNWHQGVNDEINGTPVFVSWDPLSGQAMSVNRRVGGAVNDFGVTGLVYRSTSLYYDRLTQSIWSFMQKRAITGPMSNYKLEEFPTFVVQLKHVKKIFPDALVMSRVTGYQRDYNQNPYGTYPTDTSMLFPVRYFDASLPRKEYMLGVTLKRGHQVRHVAFPITKLLEWQKAKGIKFTFGNDIFPGRKDFKMTIHYMEPLGRFEVTSPQDDVEIDATYAYWFVWSAFHPKTHVVRYMNMPE